MPAVAARIATVMTPAQVAATAVAHPARAGAAVMASVAPLTASGAPGRGAVATATPIVHASPVPAGLMAKPPAATAFAPAPGAPQAQRATPGNPAAPAGRAKASAPDVTTVTAPVSGAHAGVMTTAQVAATAVARPARAGRRMTGHASVPTLNGMADGHMLADAALTERGTRKAKAGAEAATSTMKHAPIARVATLATALRRMLRPPAAAARAR